MVSKRWVVLGCLIPVLALAQQQANLDFEIDTSPKDDSPDGWRIAVTNQAKFEYWRGQAASGRFCARTIHERRDQSSVLAYRADQLTEYPWLAFCHFPNHIGSIAVDDIAIEASAPPD